MPAAYIDRPAGFASGATTVSIASHQFYPARAIEIIWQIALRVNTTAHVVMLVLDLHRVVQKLIDGSENGFVAVTIFGLQQTHANKRKNFRVS
jgi:hypothetical protein